MELFHPRIKPAPSTQWGETHLLLLDYLLFQSNCRSPWMQPQGLWYLIQFVPPLIMDQRFRLDNDGGDALYTYYTVCGHDVYKREWLYLWKWIYEFNVDFSLWWINGTKQVGGDKKLQPMSPEAWMTKSTHSSVNVCVHVASTSLCFQLRQWGRKKGTKYLQMTGPSIRCCLPLSLFWLGLDTPETCTWNRW